MFLYLTFIICILPYDWEEYFKKEGKFILQQLSGNKATCPELGHPIWPTLSVITKKPKSFRQWNFTPYLPAVEATFWLNFSLVAMFRGKILQFCKKCLEIGQLTELHCTLPKMGSVVGKSWRSLVMDIYQSACGLLTKSEVKMAGYWLSSFLLRVYRSPQNTNHADCRQCRVCWLSTFFLTLDSLFWFYSYKKVFNMSWSHKLNIWLFCPRVTVYKSRYKGPNNTQQLTNDS